MATAKKKDEGLTVTIRLPKAHADWLAEVVKISGEPLNTVMQVIMAMAIQQELARLKAIGQETRRKAAKG